jgi:hypothetical protein
VKRYPIVVVLLALLLAACGAAGDDASVAGTGSTTTGAHSTTTAATETTTSGALTEPGATTQPGEGSVSTTQPDENVTIAVSDLADRLGIEPSAIVVQSVAQVTWRDGSLGCPQPGMSYTQALVNGVQIILDVDGTLYQYHSGRGKPPFYCANPSDPLEGAAGGR